MNTTTDFDVEQFAAHVARLQHEHANRSEELGAMRSAVAIRSWGERVPASLDVTTREALVAEHRKAWLLDAECVVRTLDWQAFTQGSFHVIDGRDIGIPDGIMGIAVGAHLHDLARAYLPRGARNPLAAVAVMPEAVARQTVGLVCGGRDKAIAKIRAAVACVAAHEYAHHVVAVIEGQTIPLTASIEGTIGLLRSSGHNKPVNALRHNAAWCRAYGHLVKRAAFVARHDVWIDRYRADLRAATAVDPDAVLDALHSDFARFSSDDALVDVIRTAAPPAFLSLFPDTPAAVSA